MQAQNSYKSLLIRLKSPHSIHKLIKNRIFTPYNGDQYGWDVIEQMFAPVEKIKKKKQPIR
jgi:hypothetical protein